MSFSKYSTVASGTPFFGVKHGDKNERRSGNQNVTMYVYMYICGCGWICSKTQSLNVLEKEMEKKDLSDKQRQQTDDDHNNDVGSSQNRSDQ